MRSSWHWLITHRRRMAPLVLLAAAVVVGPLLGDAMSRETLVRYRLGPDHREIRALRVSYRVGDEEARGVAWEWPEGAPATVDHAADLPPGRYAVIVELFGEGGVRRVRRALTVPADGRVTLDLVGATRASLP